MTSLPAGEDAPPDDRALTSTGVPTVPATHALDTPSTALPPMQVPVWVRYLDLVVLAITLPVFLIASLPMAGWAAGAGAWLVQRALQAVIERRADRSTDPRTTVGLLAGSMIGRGWLVALTILLVGLGDSKDGLAAALLVISLFTIYLSVQMIVRPLEKKPRSA
jgi:hypothetical protein